MLQKKQKYQKSKKREPHYKTISPAVAEEGGGREGPTVGSMWALSISQGLPAYLLCGPA